MCAATVNWTLFTDISSPANYVMLNSTISCIFFASKVPSSRFPNISEESLPSPLFSSRQFQLTLARRRSLKLRPTVDRDTGPGDPASRVRCEEYNDIRNIFRLADSLQGLHPKRDLPPRLGFREVRHVRIDHAWRDRIHPNAQGPEHGRPVLDKSLDCSFGRRIGKDRTAVQTGFANYGACHGRRQHNNV